MWKCCGILDSHSNASGLVYLEADDNSSNNDSCLLLSPYCGAGGVFSPSLV